MILIGESKTESLKINPESKSKNPWDSWSNHKVIAQCECDHPWHYIQFVWFTGGQEDQPELYVEVGLQKRSFWKRLIFGIRYIFGRVNNYIGSCDTASFDIRDVRKLVPALQNALELMEIEEKRYAAKLMEERKNIKLGN